MFGLRDLVVTSVDELTGELRFYHKPSGEVKRAPQVVKGSLEAPRPGEWQEAADYPFVRVALHRGSFHAVKPQPCYVILYAGIWTPGSIEDGDADIISLIAALGRIVEKRDFGPWLLSESCPYTIGLQDPGFEGMQRHPFHYGAVFTEFSAFKRP